jgi:hypothetical protein
VTAKKHNTTVECQAVRDHARRVVARNCSGREDLTTLIDMMGLRLEDDTEAIALMQRSKPVILPLASDPSFAFHQ